MTRVYVDIDAFVGPASADPDADDVRSLGYLEDAGHEVVLVGRAPANDRALGPWAATAVPQAPLRPEAPAWYLTADVERSRGRTSRLRTVLIGGTPPAGAIHRPDGFARDVQAAVLEILAAEAMPAP